MIDVKTVVRDLVSQRLWQLSDRLNDVGASMFTNERDTIHRVMSRLPMPSRIVWKAQGLLSNLAFKLAPPTCVYCDEFPCGCARKAEYDKYRQAVKTWLTEELVEQLHDLVENTDPAGLNYEIAKRDFDTNPSVHNAIAYRTCAWSRYGSCHPGFGIDDFQAVFIQTEEWIE